MILAALPVTGSNADTDNPGTSTAPENVPGAPSAPLESVTATVLTEGEGLEYAEEGQWEDEEGEEDEEERAEEMLSGSVWVEDEVLDQVPSPINSTALLCYSVLSALHLGAGALFMWAGEKQLPLIAPTISILGESVPDPVVVTLVRVAGALLLPTAALLFQLALAADRHHLNLWRQQRGNMVLALAGVLGAIWGVWGAVKGAPLVVCAVMAVLGLGTVSVCMWVLMQVAATGPLWCCPPVKAPEVGAGPASLLVLAWQVTKVEAQSLSGVLHVLLASMALVGGLQATMSPWAGLPIYDTASTSPAVFLARRLVGVQLLALAAGAYSLLDAVRSIKTINVVQLTTMALAKMNYTPDMKELLDPPLRSFLPLRMCLVSCMAALWAALVRAPDMGVNVNGADWLWACLHFSVLLLTAANCSVLFFTTWYWLAGVAGRLASMVYSIIFGLWNSVLYRDSWVTNNGTRRTF